MNSSILVKLKLKYSFSKPDINDKEDEDNNKKY